MEEHSSVDDLFAEAVQTLDRRYRDDRADGTESLLGPGATACTAPDRAETYEGRHGRGYAGHSPDDLLTAGQPPPALASELPACNGDALQMLTSLSRHLAAGEATSPQRGLPPVQASWLALPSGSPPARRPDRGPQGSALHQVYLLRPLVPEEPAEPRANHIRPSGAANGVELPGPEEAVRLGPGARLGRRAAAVAALVIAGLAAAGYTIAALAATPPLTDLSAQMVSAGQVALGFPDAGVLSGVFAHPGQTVRAHQIIATETVPGLAQQVAADRRAISADQHVVSEIQGLLQQEQATSSGDRATTTAPLDVDLANAQSQLLRDKAELATDRAKAAAGLIEAPEAGRVVSVNGTVGEIVSGAGVAAAGDSGSPVDVNPGLQFFPAQGTAAGSQQAWNPVMVLATGGPLLVNVLVPERQIGLVLAGARATITPDVPGLPPVHGVVDEIFPNSVIAAGVVSYEVQVRVDASASTRRYLAGMTGTVTIGR